MEIEVMQCAHCGRVRLVSPEILLMLGYHCPRCGSRHLRYPARLTLDMLLQGWWQNLRAMQPRWYEWPYAALVSALQVGRFARG